MTYTCTHVSSYCVLLRVQVLLGVPCCICFSTHSDGEMKVNWYNKQWKAVQLCLYCTTCALMVGTLTTFSLASMIESFHPTIPHDSQICSWFCGVNCRNSEAFKDHDSKLWMSASLSMVRPWSIGMTCAQSSGSLFRFQEPDVCRGNISFCHTSGARQWCI